LPALTDAGDRTAYLSAEGFLPDLLAELGGRPEIFGRLVLAEGPARPAAWAQNIWYAPVILPVASIGDAARQLKAIQRNWAAYAFHLHRRTSLIHEKLPPVAARPLAFGEAAPSAPLGSWCLLDEGRLLAAPRCSSPFPHGEARFVEDRSSAPSRAYLKLWEAFTVLGLKPEPGALCLDLGASPGGWSWVLQQLGARVISVDKAPLAPSVAALPGIEFRAASAFAIEPQSLPPVDWLFSDVICYPERLWRLVSAWMESGRAGNILCTLKFQGATDHDSAARFAAVPGSRLFHLAHNKHELTWVWKAIPRQP